MTTEANPSEWILRPVTPEDAHGLYTLFEAMTQEGKAAFHPHPFDFATARAVARGEQIQGPVWVAVMGDWLGGYGFLAGWKHPWPSLGVNVDPKAQGQGLGTALVRQLLAVAREAGKAGVTLTVYQDNLAAVAVYRAVGFETTRALWVMELDFAERRFHTNVGPQAKEKGDLR
ncbi:MAG: GNAT family N-acetyltransferase [Firmicutes bacterium]|jgi:ribosomal protein S18 acetylase RimI-like enzyme|nr:GNAT family N-acetyltransferase [Bacillota bacterium]